MEEDKNPKSRNRLKTAGIIVACGLAGVIAIVLGFMLAALAVLGAFKVPTAAAVFLPVLLLGVPLGDSTHAILKRLLNGKNPLIGDRTHIHHRLVDRGFTIVQAVLLIYAVAGILCIVSIGLWLR